MRAIATTPTPPASRASTRRAYLMLLVTMIFWGGNAIAGKLAAGVIPPMTLTCLRWTATALLLGVFAHRTIVRDLASIHRHLRYLVLLGTVGFAAFNFAIYGALNYTSAINVAIEQAAMPVVIMVGMFLAYGERVRPLQGLGVVVSMTGVLLTVTHGHPAALLALNINLGDALMVIGVIAYSAYSVALKRRPPLDWRSFMFTLAVAAAVVSAPFALSDALRGHLPLPEWRTPALLAYIVLFPTLIAQVAYFRSIELIGASRAGLFINLVPIFAGFFAVLLLGEHIRPYHVEGLSLVMGGIGIAEYASRRRA